MTPVESPVRDALNCAITYSHKKTLAMANFAPRVANYALKEHLEYWLYLQSLLTILIYNCKIFIVQVNGG
jgi:hypothetical protein